MATVNGMRKEPDYTAERLVMIRAQLQRREMRGPGKD